MLFKIKDFEGKEVNISPSVGLYRVKDYMGKQLYGLAILLDRVDAQGQNAEPYGVLTKSFGEFIGQKNCAYIDTNNNPFAEQLLEAGIAEQTPFDKQSGFCRYPLWHFKESFLQEVGGAAYLVYCDTFDAYMPKPRNTQEDAEKMDAFREQSAPFYIVDHDDGTFSLCLPFSFCDDAITENCQKAFDAYAESIGIPAIDSRGFHTYGNGYEWEEVFRQAFQNDPKLQEICFDSEAGGFFCNADSLEVLTDLGCRFHEICKDPEQFAALIPAAMAVAEKTADLGKGRFFRLRNDSGFPSKESLGSCNFPHHGRLHLSGTQGYPANAGGRIVCHSSRQQADHSKLAPGPRTGAWRKEWGRFQSAQNRNRWLQCAINPNHEYVTEERNMETKKQEKNTQKQKKTRQPRKSIQDRSKLPPFYGSVSHETVNSVCRGCPFKGQCNTCLGD